MLKIIITIKLIYFCCQSTIGLNKIYLTKIVPFINHLTGLPLSLILFLILGSGMTGNTMLPAFDPSKLWMYLGGTIGVLTVLLGNITVPKVDAFNITVLSFVGQSFTSMLIDIILGNTGSSTSFAGGVVICFGILEYHPAQCF